MSGTWDGEARVVSKHASDLLQIDNGKRIPPTGWVCERCDKTDNLWLNLTDGSVLCGRRYENLYIFYSVNEKKLLRMY